MSLWGLTRSKDIAIYIQGILVNGDTLGSEHATKIFDRAKKSINNNTNSTYPFQAKTLHADYQMQDNQHMIDLLL